MAETPRRLIDVLLNPSALWQLVREYFDISRLRKTTPIRDKQALSEFISTRASFVAQTSLYGYLRTRAGMRYPELFDDDPFVISINIAKWQMWLACLSDLAVYAGGLLMKNPQAKEKVVADLIKDIVNKILEETGRPEDAGDKFFESANQVRQRLALCEFQNISDNEQAFSHSPPALVEWAPIIDELKKMDEDIVINSVRFRWQKVRQDLRQALDSDEILNSLN
jgi:hypothetical protein